MLKTVSSVTNALGALVYQGTWDASANNPTLTSSVGTKGNYYVVSVAGTTTLNGISSWSVGDWAVFNGSVWQKVDGGTSESFINLTVTGTANIATGNVVNMTSSNVTITGGTENAVTYTNVTISSGNVTVTNDNVAYSNISTALRTQSLTGYLYGNANTGNVTASTSIPVANVTGAVSSVTGTSPISSSGGTTPAISLNTSGVTAASYGGAANSATITVDTYGRITAASNTAIAIANTQVSGLGTMSTQNSNSVTITGGNAAVNIANVVTLNVSSTAVIASLTTTNIVNINGSGGGNTLNLWGTDGVGIRIGNTTSSNNAYITYGTGGELRQNINGYWTYYSSGSKVATLSSDGRLSLNTSTDAAIDVLPITNSGNSNYIRITKSTYQNGGYIVNRDSNSEATYSDYLFTANGTAAAYIRNYGSVYGSGLNYATDLWNTQNGPVRIGVNNALQFFVDSSYAYFKTTAAPSNPLSGNNYIGFGNTSFEAINGVSVGTTATQITKNGNSGGIALLYCFQNGTGGGWIGIVIWRANSGATIVATRNDLGYGETLNFTVGGPYNGQLFVAVSAATGGNVSIDGVAFTNNRY